MKSDRIRAFLVLFFSTLLAGTITQASEADIQLSREIFRVVGEIATRESSKILELNRSLASDRLREMNPETICRTLQALSPTFLAEDKNISELETLYGHLSPVLRPLREQFATTQAGFSKTLEFCAEDHQHSGNLAILDGRIRALVIDLRGNVDQLGDILSFWPGFTLTKRQSKSLLDAVQSGGFTVQFLSRWTDDWDHRENIVLLGEAHVKNDRLAQIGLAAVQGYTHLGVEGATFGSPEFWRKYDQFFSDIKWILGCKSGDDQNPTQNSTIRQATQFYTAKDPSSVTYLEEGMTLTESDQEELKKVESKFDESLAPFQTLRNLDQQSKFLAGIAQSAVKWQIEQKINSTEKSELIGDRFLIHRRNEFMAESISKMSELTSQSTSLVIVGAAHVDGIAQLLVERFQFSKVVMPRISAWSNQTVSTADALKELCQYAP